jgi:hypothetical protein
MLRTGHRDDVQHVLHVVLERGTAFGGRLLQIAAVGIDMDQAALRREPPQALVVDVAHVVVDRIGAAVREDDGRLRQLEQVVEHRVRGMRLVQQDAEPVGLRHELAPLGGEALPFTRRVRRISELVVAGVHEAEHAQTLRKVELQQRRIRGERRSILHADEHHALAGGGNAARVSRRQRQFEFAGIRSQQAMDLDQALEAMIACHAVVRLGAATLRRVDHPQSAIQPALDHARQVHLVLAVARRMPLEDVPLRIVELGGCVEMAVEREDAFVQRARGG